MNSKVRPRQEEVAEERTPEQEAAIKAAAAWVGQFARTLKTCRLYDAANPTVVRFRQETETSLRRTLEALGTLVLKFTADDVLYEGASLYPARSRDDNLALPFYRDGVRSITLTPDFEPRELAALVDSVIRVTAQNADEGDDLVTLLWEAQLTGIEIDYVPPAGDGGGGSGASADGASGVPWPEAATEAESAPTATEASSLPVSPTDSMKEARSDDWDIGESAAEVEASFEELEELAVPEVRRFQTEFEAEREVPHVGQALAVAKAYLNAGTPEDRGDLSRFMPRVLRQAFIQGAWTEALEALSVLEQCASPEWSPTAFAQEMMQAISISSITERLDHQDADAMNGFIGFAERLGDLGVDVLILVLAEVQGPKHQRVLSEAIVARSRSNPERLAPYLSDPRWFVVRNAVQMLGAIGGPTVVGMLRAVHQHAEPRVRQEVLAALKQVEPRLARPLLVRMLDGADSRSFCSILHALSAERDPGVARLVLDQMKDASFEARSVEEKRAIYSTLAAVAGDAVLPELEGELVKGNWLFALADPHQQAIARCLARIGSPEAKVILERGAQSRRPAVKKACEDALVRFGSRD
jgi:hypothetical protein